MDGADFRGQRIGILRNSSALKTIVSADASKNNLTVVEIDAADLRRALAEKEVDLFLFQGPLEQLRVQLSQLSDLKPELLSLNMSSLEAVLPQLERFPIPAHALFKNLPAEDTNTLAISWRLVARKEAERAAVAALLQSLFANRLQLAQENALAWQIKGLPEEGATFAKYPNHRGALDYYNREQQTFMDLYGDWLWLALFAAGGLSSGLAWLLQTVFRRRQRLVDSILDRLLEISTEARDAKDTMRLDELAREVDGLITHAVRQARWRASSPISTTALTLAIDSSRHALTDRRQYLSRASVP